jgi:hypothetical protein
MPVLLKVSRPFLADSSGALQPGMRGIGMCRIEQG